MIITVTQVDPDIPLSEVLSTNGMTLTVTQAGGLISTLGGAAIATVTVAVPGSISGPTGPKGDTGPQGPAGQAQQSYVYTQAVAASIWNIHHGLGVTPAVVIVDSAGTLVEGDLQYPDHNNVIVTFGAAFAGTAYLI